MYNGRTYEAKFITGAIAETNRRRSLQEAYNTEHGITPKTIIKAVSDIIEITPKSDDVTNKRKLSKEEKEKLIKRLTNEMKLAAKMLEFEHAAELRDKISKLKSGR